MERKMANPIATFNTSEGSFTAEIYEDQMPITASNFLKLDTTARVDVDDELGKGLTTKVGWGFHARLCG